MHAPLHVPMGAKGRFWVGFLFHFHLIFFEVGSLVEPMVYPLGRSSWPVSSSNPSVSASSYASIARRASYVGTEGEDAHSGPHVCVPSTLLTEPSPGASINTFRKPSSVVGRKKSGPFSSQSLVHNRGGEGEGEDRLSGLKLWKLLGSWPLLKGVLFWVSRRSCRLGGARGVPGEESHPAVELRRAAHYWRTHPSYAGIHSPVSSIHPLIYPVSYSASHPNAVKLHQAFWFLLPSMRRPLGCCSTSPFCTPQKAVFLSLELLKLQNEHMPHNQEAKNDFQNIEKRLEKVAGATFYAGGLCGLLAFLVSPSNVKIRTHVDVKAAQKTNH